MHIPKKSIKPDMLPKQKLKIEISKSDFKQSRFPNSLGPQSLGNPTILLKNKVILLFKCIHQFSNDQKEKTKQNKTPWNKLLQHQTRPYETNPSSFLFSIFNIPFLCSNHHQFIKVFSLSATIFHQSEGKNKKITYLL